MQRWLLLVIFWITHIVFRSSLQGRMEYDYRKDKMIIPRRPRWLTVLSQAVLVLASFASGITQLTCFLIYIKHQNLFILWIQFSYMIAMWNIARMIHWLRNPTCNRSFVKAANEVITLNKVIGRLMPSSALEGSHLLIIFVIKFVFQIVELHSCFIISTFFVIWISLVQLSYNVYAAYQLLIISWISSINQYLRTYQQLENPSRRQRAKLLRLLKLYERISNIHRDINRIWLRISSILISDFMIVVFKWASLLYIVLYGILIDSWDKWYTIWKCGLFGGIAPIMRILFIAICNNRLAQLESFIRVQMLIISISQRNSNLCNSEDLHTFQISNLQTGFDLQVQTQPLRNKILNSNLEFGCTFLLEYFFFVLTTAISFVQYFQANYISGS
ncbi:hypothetical protein KR018_005156, partial [Drosophila ironensis]